MTTHRIVQVEVAGLGLTDRIETFSTTIIASNEELARGAHRAEALWRAGVWGLRGSLRVVASISEWRSPLRLRDICAADRGEMHHPMRDRRSIDTR